MKENTTNFHKEDIKEIIEGLTPFPENIFIKEQDWANHHFLPLISIDMGVLRADLKGTIVHMVHPFEPLEGLIGENTQKFHNEFCSENWIAFRLTEDNKYSFLADEPYFWFSHHHQKEIDEEIKLYLKENKEAYQNLKESYLQAGHLLPDKKYPDFLLNFLDNLGGNVWEGNWVDTAPIPSAFEMIEPDEETTNLRYAYDDLKNIQQRLSNESFLENAPKHVIEKEREKETEIIERIQKLKQDLSQNGHYYDTLTIKHKGEDFIFVGDVAGYNYCEHGADSILMFYEPKSRIVLFTYDWTYKLKKIFT